MPDECIHGFEGELCAICFPPPAPEPAPKPARAPRIARGSAASAAPRAARAAARPASLRPEPEKPIDVPALRLFHVTHVDNLARILGSGALLADTAGAQPVVDLAAPGVREIRRRAPAGDAVVADYVPFLLTSDAPIWSALRSGRRDPRLAPEAPGRPAADHVFVVGTVAGAFGARSDAVALADGDATEEGVVIETDRAGVEGLLRRLNRSGEETALGAAEFLVRGSYPLERVALFGVATDRVRDRVRAALTAVGSRTRVIVYPPWFRADEGIDEG